MPRDSIGQQITFQSWLDPDQKYTSYVYLRAKTGDTIAKIAARRGAPSMVQTILALNSDVRIKNGHFLRSARQVLKAGTLIRLPGTLAQQDVVSIHAANPRPKVTDGYAKYDTVDRIGRVAINRFKGYNPITIDVPLQFEAYGDGIDGQNNSPSPGQTIEDKIEILERMAGIGNYPGAQSGPPAVLQISVTDNAGNTVWLIPRNYQTAPSGLLYRITSIAWGDGALSDRYGNRIRATAVVSITQYTPLTQTSRSVTQRTQAKTGGVASAGSSLANLTGLL